MVLKVVNKYFFLFLLSVIVVVVYSYRGVYLSNYDETYKRDLYDHSQWAMAKSVRTMGDSDLYVIAGLDILKTKEYFKIAPEVPPLGELMYAAAVKIFHNGAIVSLFLYFLAAFLFYRLALLITHNPSLTRLATLIFMAEPVIFSQASVTMMDLPQLVMMLLHFLAIFGLIQKKQKSLLLIVATLTAGISFGAFTAFKIGFFSVAFLLADLYVLWRSQKLIYILPIIGIGGLTYAASYAPYFNNHSILDFLKAQKWVVTHYLSSGITPLYGMELLTFLTGQYHHWAEGAKWTATREWTVLWPLYLICFATYLFSQRKQILKLSLPTQHLLITALCLFLLFLIVPFWVRYTVLLIPLLIIFFVMNPVKHQVFNYVLVILFIAQIIFFPIPSADDAIENIENTWNKGAYQDLWDGFDSTSQAQSDRYAFWRKAQLFEHQAGIDTRTVVLLIPKTFLWTQTAPVDVQLVYKTRLGDFQHQAKAVLLKENNQWKLRWNNNLLFPNFDTLAKIEKSFILGKQGSLSLTDGTVLSREGLLPYFSVTPNKVTDEDRMINELRKLTGRERYEIEYMYKANNQPDVPVQIGFIRPERQQTKMEDEQLAEGITYEFTDARTYNPLLIKKLPLIKKAEAKHPELYPTWGGMISISSGRETRTLRKTPGNGKDVVVSTLTSYQLE